MESKPENVRADEAWLRFSIADLTCFMLGIGFVFALYASEFRGSTLGDHVILFFVSVTALGLLFSAVPILLRQVYLRRSKRLTPGEGIWACNLFVWFLIVATGNVDLPLGVLFGLINCLTPLVQTYLSIVSMVILLGRWSTPIKLSLPWTDTFGCVLSLSVGVILVFVVLMNVFRIW